MSSHTYQPRNLLVTGGAGFIGSNFIRYVLAHDANAIIYNLDLLTYAGSLKNLENLPSTCRPAACPRDPEEDATESRGQAAGRRESEAESVNRHHFIHGDICDAALVNQLLKENNIDTIVHFAAESHVDRSITGPAPFIQTNVVGTFTLLEAARKQGCRFHHISTDEVFGTLSQHDEPFTEKTPYAPNSPYSASKASSDHLVRAYFHTYQLPVTISNCSNNYGPYQHAEKLIPTIIRSCLNGQPIPIYGDGSNIRDWLYVEDHCAAIFNILQRGKLGETYNIGGNNEVNNLTMANMICDLLDQHRPQDKPYRDLIQFVTDRPGHDWRYAINSSKMASELAWFPRETIQSGLQKTIQYYVL